ncbi:MAG: hypothetical protein R3Y13_02785 [bacterium]
MYDVEFLLGNLFIELFDSNRNFITTHELSEYAVDVVASVNAKSDKKIIFNFVREVYEDLRYTCPSFVYEYRCDGFPVIHLSEGVKLDELISKYRTNLSEVEVEALVTSPVIDIIKEEVELEETVTVVEKTLDLRRDVVVALNIDSVTNSTMPQECIARMRKVKNDKY